jgi:NADPH2:quinone reductase
MLKLVAEHPGAPDELKIVDIPMPDPGPGQVRVKVAYVALTPLDVLMRQGRVGWLAGKGPFTPGLEFSGIVDKLGAGVDAKWLRQAVLSVSQFGGCAEYVIVEARRIDPIDTRLGWPMATAWRTPTLTAWYALHRVARLSRGETVMIRSGAGPVGIMATQIAREIGAKVVSLVGGATKIEFARGYGAEILVDYRLPDWASRVAEATSGRGVDVVLDGNGGGSAARNYELIAPNGRIVYLGATTGVTPDAVTVPLLIAKSFSVAGFNLNSIEPTRLATDETALWRKLSSGTLRFPVSDIVGLEGAVELHRRFEARELMGRALIRVDRTVS